MASENRIPCSECESMILPSTAEVTGGICMPCKNSKKMAEMLAAEPKDEISLLYTISPHRGGYCEVFQIIYDLDRGGPVFRYQHGGSLPDDRSPIRVGAHQIFKSFDYIEVPLSQPEYNDLINTFSSMTLPVLAEPTGGFDGVDYFLKIESLMTSVEYRWWLDLPHEWEPQLAPIIEHLTKRPEIEQVAAGNPLPAE